MHCLGLEGSGHLSITPLASHNMCLVMVIQMLYFFKQSNLSRHVTILYIDVNQGTKGIKMKTPGRCARAHTYNVQEKRHTARWIDRQMDGQTDR